MKAVHLYYFVCLEIECHKVMDLGILMDSSYSISPSLWEEEKSIVVLLMDKIDIEPLGTHMSVMTFNTAADFPIPFNGYKDKDELKRRVAELPYRPGWFRLDLGLTAVKNQMFVPQAGVRNMREVPRVLLILAKGKKVGMLWYFVYDISFFAITARTVAGLHTALQLLFYGSRTPLRLGDNH